MPRVEFVDGKIVISESSLTVHEDDLIHEHDNRGDSDDERGGSRGRNGTDSFNVDQFIFLMVKIWYYV
jgi:hypothetical protein